jgi:hypothetical protein
MKDSGYDSNSTIIPGRAAGYSATPDGSVNSGFVHMTVPYSTDALYSTVKDLLRWNQGLYAGNLLSAASIHKMTTPFKDNYAFGLVVQTVSGRKAIGTMAQYQVLIMFFGTIPIPR